MTPEDTTPIVLPQREALAVASFVRLIEVIASRANKHGWNNNFNHAIQEQISNSKRARRLISSQIKKIYARNA